MGKFDMNVIVTGTMEFIGPIEWPIRTGVGPTNFTLCYTSTDKNRYIIATKGDVSDTPSLLRIESACVFGHILDGLQCDCGDQLNQALTKIADRGKGILIYALDEDARGHGVEMHFQLYVYRQHDGRTDEREIFDQLNKPLDIRNYSPIIDILEEFDVDSVRVMTNNPDRLKSLKESAIKIDERVSIESEITEYNYELLLDEKEWMDYETEYLTDKEWLSCLRESEYGYLLIKGQTDIVMKGRHGERPENETLEKLNGNFLTLYHKAGLQERVKQKLNNHVDRFISEESIEREMN